MAAIGQLRHRIVIQRDTTSDDGKGGQTSSWATLATAWASVDPSRGNERLMAGSLLSGVEYRVRVRYRADITVQAKDRVVWDSKTLEVLSVTNQDGRDMFWLLDCGDVS